ncbi:hypothetical protein D5S18_07730 [Nocardia panacis]|uniref:Nucleotidyltransferase domain-containing protein n=1 Tax=Nocardia panacis TaxID=2340916 RepID=A0A3A4KF81_9NOCA|nr:hypothetical protein [Nocardia panacis]RJO77619.1 hypothetical protein D5S18_07730 [Nocardia panacis]
MIGQECDWFAHAATTPQAARAQVNHQLAVYTETARDCARTHLSEETSVCVSGSLARGEPSCRYRDGGYLLGSDVDLVAVLDHDDDHGVLCVEKFLCSVRERHPEIDTTVFVLHRPNLRRVSGRFGADLHHAATQPLSGRPLTGVAAPRISEREALEGITHQLATIYCPDSPAGTNPWQSKTALEALRAVAARDLPGPQRYSALADDPAVCEVADPMLVARLVRARELNTASPIAAHHCYELVVAAMCCLFGVAIGHRELIAALHTPRTGMHVLDGFQHAVTAATIILYGPSRLRQSAASALHLIVTAIDRDTLPTSRDAVDALVRISPVEFSRGIDHPNHVLHQHLQALRRDYYSWLGPHNFGARPVANYRGPAPDTRIQEVDA